MGQCCAQDEIHDNDISKDIKIIRHSDTSSKYPLSNLFDDNPETFWYSDGIKDIFYILDIGEGGNIETLELTFSPHLYCSSMRFLVPINNDPYDDNPKNWKQIIKKSKMKNGFNKIQFDSTNAEHQHLRYIKLSFDEIRGTSVAGGGQLGVEKLKIYGTCGKIMKKQKTKIYLEQNIFNIGSKIKVTSNSDAFSTSDDIQNIYNDRISYWSSSKVAKGETVWITFDCNECVLQEIECMFHSKYVCKTISVETCDDNHHFEQIPGLKEKSIKQLLFDHDTETKHKRYIKIIFNDIPKDYLCLNQIKFYGKDPNTDTNEKEAQDMDENKDEKEEEDEDVQYKDITCCFSINLVRDVGSFDTVNFDVKNVLSSDTTTYWASPNRTEMKSDDKDIYLIFDVDECYIQRIEIMYAHNKDMHCNTIKIYTADDIEDDEWHMIAQQQHLAFAELNKIKLKPHKRYIKIYLDDLEDLCFGALSYVKFIGTEPKAKDDVTFDIKACDTSLTQTQTEVQDIFKPNAKFWAAANSEQAFIVFDCNCYEIQRIKIKFFACDNKCGAIRIAMSDVKNVYNFKEDRMVIDLTQNDPQRKKLIEEIVVDDIYSKDGFHRYIMLRFDNNKSNVAIQQIRFYGVKSDIIPDEILYELEQQKSALAKLAEDESGAIQFGDLPIKLVSHSAAFENPQFKIENLWNDERSCWISEQKLKTVYFTFDLDAYKVKQLEITLNAQYPCKICTIFTGDTKNKKEMKSICTKDKFDEDIEAPRIVALKEDHSRFIRMEFSEMKADFFGAERFKFVGDGLDKETRELNIDDLYDGCDEDLIHEYLKQLEKQQAAEMAKDSKIDAEIIQKDGNNLGSKQWEQHKKQSLQVPVKYLYLMTEAKSKLCRTKFEEEEHMRFATKQRELKQKAADNQFIAEVKGMKRLKASKVKIEKAMQEYQKLTADGHQMRAQKKFMEYQTMMAQEQAAQNKMFEAMNDDHQRLLTLFGEKTKKKVFYEWCESIDTHHAMKLSSRYNVKQYEDCASWGINKFDKEEVVARHKKLADLLDASFDSKTRKMHKFHMFLLSTTYHYAREPGYDKTCWLILDCADICIHHIEFQFQAALQCKSVKIYTSATYDDTESKTSDDGFELIHTKEIIGASGGMQQMMQQMMAAQMGAAAAKIGIDTTVKIPFNHWKGGHSRYIKLEFCDFLTGQYVGIERLKIYAEPKDDDTWYNEDFQLKIVSETTKFNSVSGAINIYKKDSDYYWRTQSQHKVGHIIFQTDDKQITSMEILPEKGYPPGKIAVYQSDSGDKDTNWEIVCEKDDIDADGLNVLEFKTSSNKKYIKVEVTQTNDDLSYLGISFMKFYGETKSPLNGVPKLYNIASQVPIISNSGSFADPNIVLHNMYIADSSLWMNANQLKNPSMDIENKIRDTVCETLNKLRKGGDILRDEKHFCKFLLCWILKTHYDEILSTAKSVMSILRKPLDEEYQRLTDIQSPILSLSLSSQHKVAENVKSNREILEPTYKHWYKFRKAMFWPNDLQKIGEEWMKIGLCETMPQFVDIRRLSFPLEEKEEAKDFTDCDELVMDFLNRIAIKLDKSFQNAMKTAFATNREQMDLSKLRAHDTDLGVISGPIKTKSRQTIKIKLDYNDAAHPRCMSVLDIVRCAIICETDDELVSLHNLLCAQFSGAILRTKNAFDVAIENQTYGYRAVLMNIVYGDEAVLPKEYQMICEVQLILSKYFTVRKKMHLGYTICRSQEGGIAEKKKPYYVLAEDCCKFGKLDV